MYDEYVHSKINIYIFYANGTCNVLQLTMVTMNFLSSICAYTTMSLSYRTHKHIDRFPFSFGIQNIRRARQYIICLNHLRFNLLTVFITFAFHRLANFVLGWNNEKIKKKEHSRQYSIRTTHYISSDI